MFIEDVQKISVYELIKNHPKHDWKNAKSVIVNETSFDLTETRTGITDGMRLAFICCQKPVRVLYSHKGRIGCSQCLGLTNFFPAMRRSPIYFLLRKLNQLNRIDEKLRRRHLHKSKGEKFFCSRSAICFEIQQVLSKLFKSY